MSGLATRAPAMGRRDVHLHRSVEAQQRLVVLGEAPDRLPRERCSSVKNSRTFHAVTSDLAGRQRDCFGCPQGVEPPQRERQWQRTLGLPSTGVRRREGLSRGRGEPRGDVHGAPRWQRLDRAFHRATARAARVR